MKSSSPELLKRAVLELVGECKLHLAEGSAVDVSEVERGVRAYCTALAALPVEEGRKHAEDLQALMEVMTEFSGELVAARNEVHAELQALGRLRTASNAYQKSDTIAGPRKPRADES